MSHGLEKVFRSRNTTTFFQKINESVDDIFPHHPDYWLVPISPRERKKLLELGLRVKAHRERKKLTLKALGYAIDKDPQSIHRLEKGQVNPSYLYLLQLCAGLEISIADLAKENE